MGCGGSKAIDADEAMMAVAQEAPEIPIVGEVFLFAFAWSRDQVYFTNYRILVKDKQGIFGSSIKWKTIPYSAISAFFVETAGSFDPNVTLGLWISGWSWGDFDKDEMMPSPRYEIKFKKGGGVDLFALQRLLNYKIYNIPDGEQPEPVEVAPQPEGEDESSSMSKFMDVLGGDASAVDPSVVQEQLRADPPVLMPDEVVDMAFKCGRDTYAFTTRRMLVIDVKGMSGKMIRYTSYLWSSIKAFAVETPGAFLDRDCEIKLWNGISHIEEQLFSMDLRDSSTDVMAIQRYLTDRILGQDEAPPSAEANGGGDSPEEEGGWMEWFTGDSRQIDAAEANRMFHEDVKILQGSETCEMAFKASRDTILFTTKRMVMIDVQGFGGKKVEYKSIPWGCVQAFGLQSPAAYFDKDSEMMIWTDIFHTYKTEKVTVTVKRGEEEVEEEKTIYIPDAGPVSYISVDFQKDKVDLPAVGRYLASRCAVLGSQTSMPPTPAPEEMLVMQSDPGMLESFISWLGDDYRACDPEELDAKLRGECSMLLPDERVQMGFVCGRDTIILTTHRAMKIDKQGFTGKKVLYLSLPWTKIKKYEVCSAGTWDLDSEMTLTIKAPWYNREVGKGLSIDFARGRCDVLALNQFISAQVIGTADGTSVIPWEIMPPQPEGLIGEFFSWLGDDFHQISAMDATMQFANAPRLLLADETVELAFKCGKDFFMATTKRWLKVDVQSRDRAKVLCTSVPIRFVPCFNVTTAAKNIFDSDAEIDLLTTVGGWGFDVKKDQGDIMSVYTLMNQKCVMDKQPNQSI